MAIRALLLDAGGTLLSEKSSRQAMYAEAAARHRLSVDEATMRACMAKAHAALPQTVAGNWRYSKPWFEAFIADVFCRQLAMEARALPALTAELFTAFADAKNFRWMPGAQELLANAADRKIKLALVSNWSPYLTEVLGGLGARECFDAILLSGAERVEKPDPAIFERALARLNVPASQALHVGNDPVQDVRGATGCGIQALLFDPENQHAALNLPRIRALGEIIPWIERQR